MRSWVISLLVLGLAVVVMGQENTAPGDSPEGGNDETPADTPTVPPADNADDESGSATVCASVAVLSAAMAYLVL